MFGPMVLVVEDDFEQGRQAARALLEAGYDVSEASEDLEAISLLDARKIHLVLTDIRMPCLDGISLLKHTKTFSRQVPVAVTAAYPEEIEDLEVNALLYRPFGEEAPTGLIRRLISGPPPRASIEWQTCCGQVLFMTMRKALGTDTNSTTATLQAFDEFERRSMNEGVLKYDMEAYQEKDTHRRREQGFPERHSISS